MNDRDVTLDDGVEAMLLRHRHRFVAPLLAPGDWLDGDDRGGDDGGGPVATVVALRARPGSERLGALDGLSRRLAGDGVLAVVATGDTLPLRQALAARFARVACWRQRAVGGSILAREQFAGVRMAALADADAAGAGSCSIFVCSARPLPALVEGVYEADGPACEIVTDEAVPFDRPDVGEAAAWRARAAALANRLVGLEQDRVAAFVATHGARARHGGGGWHDRPAERHSWPLYEATPSEPFGGGLYDHRTEDDLVGAAREGAAFMRRFDLDGVRPDFAGAVALLNGLRRGAALAPEASVVVPIHGQLGYTLNCLHALFTLADRTAFEVIVVDDASPDASARHLGAVAGIRMMRQGENRGFIAAANLGATAARGGIIVMLNNDTRVLPGWLDTLVGSFAQFPRAGIVGSKLLYPDGTLQEAGGIVWRDGQAWNYGRGDDPNRPQYCFARQVDYVSGASIAIAAPVWAALGGFDAHFAPAYYEDCDLFFRAREAGYETWLQSGSRVIHYEGRTAGTDLDVGTKAFQRVNARKFRVRHRAALVDHQPLGAPVVVERDRVRRRHALVVEATVPTPKEDAGSLYAVMTMRLLVELGYSVTFVPQDNFLYRPGYTEALMRMGVECVHAPYDVEFDRFIEREGARFDLALVFRAGVFERIHAALRRFAPQAPLIFDVSDLEYLRLERGAALTGDAAARVAAARVKAGELAVMAHADCVLSPSPYEVTLIAAALPDAAVVALPLMVETPGTRVGPEPRRDLCFLGGYAHPPNVDAVGYFVAAIMPSIRKAAPGTRFVVAGANPTAAVRALAGPDVCVTGFLDDLAPTFDAARVFVCPLRYGAGMKGKILSAMAHGVPVVTTSVGIEGILAEDGSDVLVADGADAIAAACLRLMRDDALWSTLSRNGLHLVRRHYAPASGRAALRRAIDVALERWAGRAA